MSVGIECGRTEKLFRGFGCHLQKRDDRLLVTDEIKHIVNRTLGQHIDS
jgi:hypothetical protein